MERIEVMDTFLDAIRTAAHHTLVDKAVDHAPDAGDWVVLDEEAGRFADEDGQIWSGRFEEKPVAFPGYIGVDLHGLVSGHGVKIRLLLSTDRADPAWEPDEHASVEAIEAAMKAGEKQRCD